MSARTPAMRERDRKRRAAYYLRHKLGGICVLCTAPAGETVFCERHRAVHGAQKRALRAKARNARA